MKLLFDANLSFKLAIRLQDVFPLSTHVFDAGMVGFTPDEVIWKYARHNGFAIVTADSDFIDLLNKLGAPPKVIRLERCDYKTSVVETLIRSNAIRIVGLDNSERNLLVLRRPR